MLAYCSTVGTAGVPGTAPEMTNTDKKNTSEVAGQLPIGAPAAPIKMVTLLDVPLDRF